MSAGRRRRRPFDKRHHSAARIEPPKLRPAEIAASDAASESDRLWFEQHPERNHRVRRARAFELSGLTPKKAAATWIVVRQFRPGMRMRFPFGIEIPDIEDIANSLVDWQLTGVKPKVPS